ncbi:unnamed protein product, partial [Effrenium voratum]
GVTLLELIRSGAIETPEEMSFPRWQAWRRGPGRRPTRRVDGRGIRTAEEVELWRSVMAALYGEERVDDLEEEEEAEVEGPPQGPLALVPVRPAGSTEETGADAAPQPIGLVGAGAGTPTGGVGAGGRVSPRSSAGSSAPGADEVRQRIFASHDPRQSSLEAFLSKMRRLVSAMEVFGMALAQEEVDQLELRARVPKMVMYLRDKFMSVALEEGATSEEKGKMTLGLAAVIQDLGGRVSSKPGKVFSTPSDELKEEEPPRGQKRAVPEDASNPELSQMRAKLAALEMELEGIKRGSEASSPEKDLAMAVEAQTAALTKALDSRGPNSTVTSVKTDLHWPTLTDDSGDVRDVSEMHFEDNCGLANSCRGMSYREMPLALRSRCRGSLLDDWRAADSNKSLPEPWTGETWFKVEDPDVGRRSHEARVGALRSEDWFGSPVDTSVVPIHHIVEVPGGIERIAEETPTDEYYDMLRADLLARRHGDGTSPDEDRAQAIRDFPPLKEKLHTQQFLGCANWLRQYLPVEFGHAAKVLNAYQKPGAEYPPGGLGSGSSPGCLAFKAIKEMMTKHVGLSVLDEAAALSGASPLEQIADASGIAVGGTVVQMSRDLTKLKVLLTHSKSLTPSQQAWAPLVQEAFALEAAEDETGVEVGVLAALTDTDRSTLVLDYDTVKRWGAGPGELASGA